MRQIVSLSGGKDSTCMLLMMLERGEQIDEVVFFDWGMEFPQMYEHLSRLEDKEKITITRLQPPNSFEYYMFDIVKTRGSRKGQKGYGWAHFGRRWCTRVKLDAINKYCGDALQCIGIAADEKRTILETKRYPLVEWRMTSADALDYCKSKGYDWSGLYDRFDRVSCWCCPLQNQKALRSLKDYFPNLWEKILDYDERTPYPYPNNNLSVVLDASKDN